MFESLKFFDAGFLFFLINLTKFSVCRTESFLLTILFAINSALSSPTKIFACPDVIFFFLINRVPLEVNLVV
jgi:hypothetical protein